MIDTVDMILRDHPRAGRMGRVKDTRELVIDGIPYSVVYRQINAPAELQILRVLHDAQQWPPPGLNI